VVRAVRPALRVTWANPGGVCLISLVNVPSTMGGAAGTRTPDLRRARAALSQLSYGPLASAPARSRTGCCRRWARLDSNQGPRPYQGRALTS
jgi:hypothetical protein